MYRLLSLLTLLALSEQHYFHNRGHHGCRHHNHSRGVETNIEVIQQNIVDRETAFQKYCAANQTDSPREVYGPLNYSLKYQLANAMDAKVTIQIKHKFIHTTVEKANAKVLDDVRILPEIVKPTDAVWSLVNNDLIVTIPYKVPLGTEVAKACGDTSDVVVNVPMKQYVDLIPRNPNINETGLIGPGNTNVY